MVSPVSFNHPITRYTTNFSLILMSPQWLKIQSTSLKTGNTASFRTTIIIFIVSSKIILCKGTCTCCSTTEAMLSATSISDNTLQDANDNRQYKRKYVMYSSLTNNFKCTNCAAKISGNSESNSSEQKTEHTCVECQRHTSNICSGPKNCTINFVGRDLSKTLAKNHQICYC